MNKYYVQSHKNKRVSNSNSAELACDEFTSLYGNDLCIASQRGYVLDRDPLVIYSDEYIKYPVDVFTTIAETFNEEW